MQRLLGMLVALVSMASLAARAQPARADDVHELRYDLRVDIPVTGVALALWLGSEWLKDDLARDTCRLCDPNRFDARAQDRLSWSNSEPAGRASNWLGFGILPLGTALGMGAMAIHGRSPDAFWIDTLLIAEAAFLTADLNQIVKLAVSRERPFVNALDDTEKRDTRRPADNNLSFFSAHSSVAFSMVVAAGTVASLRGYRAAPWVWAMGLPLAGFTGYLRIASDRHYLSDVLTGAVLGSALGFLIPFFLHPRVDSKGPELSLSAREQTLVFTVRH